MGCEDLVVGRVVRTANHNIIETFLSLILHVKQYILSLEFFLQLKRGDAMSQLKPRVSVNQATHVKVKGGRVERIVSKWGIKPNGGYAKPSEGGFGVVTESGRRVGMWDALSYLKEE